MEAPFFLSPSLLARPTLVFPKVKTEKEKEGIFGPSSKNTGDPFVLALSLTFWCIMLLAPDAADEYICHAVRISGNVV